MARPSPCWRCCSTRATGPRSCATATPTWWSSTTAPTKAVSRPSVVLNYGTNESSFAAFLTREYEIELREAIRRVRAALPNASILVMSPMDRGQKNGGEIETLPTIPRIVDIQRRVAAELHCGFFNTFEVMGGAGTMARWYDSQPRLVSADFIHPTPAGARIVATAFVRELTAGLSRYKLRQVLERNAVAEVR